MHRKLVRNAVLLAAVLVSAGVAQDTPKKISKAEALSAVITKVPPAYPPMARQLKVQGEVELEVTVAENGTVAKVDIVSGNPMLTGPSVQAVKLWKFKPFQDGGKSIAVMAPISIDFKL